MDPKHASAISATRQRVGWAYSQLPWPTREEAEVASARRAELLADLGHDAEHGFAGTKIHLGALSPGCSICGSGGWGCNYINGLCSRHCFFCPQDRTMTEERDPMTSGNVFLEPDDHVRYLRDLGIEGVGFSGGEPLLVLDRLVAHVEAIRRELGDSVYVWVYSNGDPVDEDALRRLRQAGLDEIRFNLAARGYDLAPVRLATEHISTVSVEIPAIPEHLERLKRLVVELEAIGVAFLNLHQLTATEYNFAALRERGYHFLHQPSVPVLESELCALELLRFIRDRELTLGAQYCSSAFKNRFQERGQRLQLARLAVRDGQEITPAGYLRQVRMTAPPAAGSSPVEDPGRLEPPRGAEITIVYSRAELLSADGSAEAGGRRFTAASRTVHSLAGMQRAAFDYWRRLYLEDEEPERAFAAFFREFGFRSAADATRFRDVASAVRSVADFERIESGLPEIF